MSLLEKFGKWFLSLTPLEQLIFMVVGEAMSACVAFAISWAILK